MTTKFDIAFVLDDSGSISSSDFTKMRDECKQLSDRFTENDRLALFMFASSVSKLTSFTDKDTFAECLSSYRRTNGMTALYSGINSATTEFKNYSTDASRIMIVVTDGYNNQSGASSATVINNAIEENVIIYCVGVGSVNSTVLKNISESTGGCYYYINQFSQLNGIFENIISETDLYKDSDGDGLADSEEVEIRKIPNSENYYCYMVSNPCVVDTDCDSYNDYVEEYIGSSPVSKINKIEQTESSTSGYSVKWSDWQELIEEHAWNYIHNAVEAGSSFEIWDYKVQYSNMNNGLIVYSFKKKQPDEVPVPVPAPETEKDDNYVYVPQYQPAQEIQFWGTVAAVLIVGGTNAEDVITGGGGIADDAASFYLAYRLMFGL